MKYNKGFVGVAVLGVLLLAGIGTVVYLKTKHADQKIAVQINEVPVPEQSAQTTTPTVPKSSTNTKTTTPIQVDATIDFEHNPNLTEYQKQDIRESITIMSSYNNSIGYTPSQNETREQISHFIDAQLTASEAVLKNSITKTGIPSTAEIYFSQHNNSYGTNASENFCTDKYFKAIVQDLAKYTVQVPVCKVSAFPSQSYTFIIASTLQKGYYYCDDPKNKGVLIKLSGTYKAGERCQ